MNPRTGTLNISRAKEIDLVNYLTSLGYHPHHVSGQNYWYNSPLHEDRTPSFKINRQINRWYDFGMGMGGSIINFGTLFHHCTVSELLQKLSAPLSAGEIIILECPHDPKALAASPLVISRESSLQSFTLNRYLNKRRIPLAIAKKYCREITYSTHHKNYVAIGFKNSSGGYELRNEYFKGSSSPKDLSFIDQGGKHLAVFEGFFDFLSYQTIFQQPDHPPRNFLVLNSVSFFEKAKPIMLAAKTVQLYLDRDPTGQKYTEKALALGAHVVDESALYQKYKDFNDWIQHIGQSPKKDRT
jgi:hypothetical protein